MRKFIFSLFSFIVLCGAVSAQTLNVSDVQATPGGKVSFALSLSIPDGQAWQGFQFETSMPSELSFTGETTTNESWTKGDISVGTATGKVSASSNSNSVIPTGNIEIGTIELSVASDAAQQDYEVTISNFELLSTTARQALSNVTFKVKVVETVDWLTIADVEVVPGEKVSYALTLTIPEGQSWQGFQYEMVLPEGITLTGSTTANASWQKGDIVVNQETAKASASSNTNSIIPTGEIEIGTVELLVDESAEVKEYEITLKKFELLSTTARQAVTNVTFKVNVVESHVLVLDADSGEDLAPIIKANIGKTIDVNVVRSLPEGEWSTIVLPFDIPDSEIKAAFGGMPELAYFTSAEDQKDEAGNVTGVTINFEDDVQIYANTPMLIKAPAGYDGTIKMTGAEILANEYYYDTEVYSYDKETSSAKMATYVSNNFAENAPALFGVNSCDATLSGRSKPYNISKANVFVGTYSPLTGTIGTNNDFYVKGNKFYHANGANAKPTRAYFSLNNSEYAPTASDGAVRMVIHTDDEATGIKSVKEVVNLGGAVYNLQGQRVESVKKGLYIQNGKKYFVK